MLLFLYYLHMQFRYILPNMTMVRNVEWFRINLRFMRCLRYRSSCYQRLVGWLVGFLTSSSTTRLYSGRAPRQERLTILRAATHETELGDHGFCFSQSHYTDTDPTSRERAATAGIEPGSSLPGLARSTAELPRPTLPEEMSFYAPVIIIDEPYV